MNGKTVGFFDKDSSKAYEQIKEALYSRLKMVERDIADYEEDELCEDSEDFEVHGYLNCLISEKTFLSNLIDKMERS